MDLRSDAARRVHVLALCAEYYVPIDEKSPTVISERAVEMVRRLVADGQAPAAWTGETLQPWRQRMESRGAARG